MVQQNNQRKEETMWTICIEMRIKFVASEQEQKDNPDIRNADDLLC